MNLKHNLVVAQGHMKEQADLHRRNISFKPGDLVYLKLEPYKFKSLARKLNEKLNPRFCGPFAVVDRIGQLAYKLDLPPTACIHPVFHVSQLKGSLHSSIPIQPLPPFLTEDLELQVQPAAVLSVRPLVDGSQEVLIQWKDLPLFKATWESYEVIDQQHPHFYLEDKVLKSIS